MYTLRVTKNGELAVEVRMESIVCAARAAATGLGLNTIARVALMEDAFDAVAGTTDAKIVTVEIQKGA